MHRNVDDFGTTEQSEKGGRDREREKKCHPHVQRLARKPASLSSM